MKSNFSIKRLLAALGFALISTSILIGCSDDEGSNAAPIPNQGYHYVNGQCYDSGNRVVSQSYCGNVNNCSNNTGYGNNGYRWNGSQCLDQYNRPANPSYCSNQGTGNNNCQNNNGGYQWINGQCYDYNNQIVSSSYCSNTGTGNTGGTCSDGVNIPGYGCIPRGGCSAGYVMWYGQCTYVGQ